MKPSTIIKNFKESCQYKGHYFNSLNIDQVCFNGAIDRAINPELFPKEITSKTYIEHQKIFSRLLEIYAKNRKHLDAIDILHNLTDYNDNYEFDMGQKLAYDYLRSIGL